MPFPEFHTAVEAESLALSQDVSNELQTLFHALSDNSHLSRPVGGLPPMGWGSELQFYSFALENRLVIKPDVVGESLPYVEVFMRIERPEFATWAYDEVCRRLQPFGRALPWTLSPSTRLIQLSQCSLEVNAVSRDQWDSLFTIPITASDDFSSSTNLRRYWVTPLESQWNPQEDELRQRMRHALLYLQRDMHNFFAQKDATNRRAYTLLLAYFLTQTVMIPTRGNFSLDELLLLFPHQADSSLKMRTSPIFLTLDTLYSLPNKTFTTLPEFMHTLEDAWNNR